MAVSKNSLKALKDKVAVRTRIKRAFDRKGSDLIVIAGPVSLGFFTLAFLIFLPLLRRDYDWLRALIVLYGAFVVLWAWMVIYEFLVKGSRLLANKRVHNYSQLAALNTILGLAFPLFVLNSVKAIVVNTLSEFTYFGTAICEIRLSLVRFYYASNIYEQINSVIFWIVVLSLVLLIIGGLFERVFKK